MSTSKDTCPAQEMIAPFEIFKFQWSGIKTFTVDGVAMPSIRGQFVNTGIQSLADSGYLTTIAQQYIKLRYYFNLYEEFTILEDRIDYDPFLTPLDVMAFQTVDSTEPKTAKTAEWLLHHNMSAPTTKVTLIPDKNDHQITNTLDCYWQMRSRPEARTFRLTEPFSFATRPTANDLRIICNPNNAQLGQNNNPFIPNIVSGVSNTGTWLEWGPPEKLGWLPTKVMNPSDQWVLNYTPNYYGYKEYIYVPIASNLLGGGTGANSTSIDYGMNDHTITFAFRKFDYRPIYANLAGEALLANEVQLNAVLNDVTGREMIREGTGEPSFKRIKTDEEVQQDEIRSRVLVP